MSPLHDVDVLLLLATSLAAKRRPAETGEIVAAIDLVNGNVPGEEKLAEAFARLGTAGLLVAAAGGIGLSPAAEGLIEILPRKGDHAQRLFELRGLLGAYRPAEEAPAITVAAADLGVQLLDLAGEAVGRKPPGEGLPVEEGTVDLFGSGAQHAVQADGSGGHGLSFGRGRRAAVVAARFTLAEGWLVCPADSPHRAGPAAHTTPPSRLASQW